MGICLRRSVAGGISFCRGNCGVTTHRESRQTNHFLGKTSIPLMTMADRTGLRYRFPDPNELKGDRPPDR